MQSSFRLEASRFCRVADPGIKGPFAIMCAGLAGAVAFGSLGANLLGHTPSLPPRVLSALDDPGIAILAVGVCFLDFLLAALITAGYARRCLGLAAHRLGWSQVRESEGSCRLVEDIGGRWALEMDVLEGDGSSHESMPRLFPRSEAALYIPLDEASAATIAHLFTAGETLRLRWLDLPAFAGGPTLLEVLEAEPAAAESVDVHLLAA